MLQTVPLRIFGNPFGMRAVLSERAGRKTDLVDLHPHERVISIYRFAYPVWKRVDEESGASHKLLADSTWGASDKFTGSYVGYKISLLGAAPFVAPNDELVVKTREVADSGQWATSYLVAAFKGNSLRRLATVQGLWDVDAHITSPDADGNTLLHLHGIETPKEAPFMRDGPKVDADIYFDGAHWVAKNPAEPTFGLYESNP